MTLARAREVVVEFSFRCDCGAFIFSTEATVNCGYCSRVFGIRRVKRPRNSWTTVPPGAATKGWRWRKKVVESVVERTFRFQCPCGSTIVTTSNMATCADCGQAVGVRRVMNRGQFEVVVGYRGHCCFCSAPIVATGRIVTCASCGNTLEVVRVGTHRQYWKAVPRLPASATLKQSGMGGLVNSTVLFIFLTFCLICTYFLAQYAYDVMKSD